MRNLKKVLSLALAMVMLLGMMVVGAGATNFKDVDDISDDYKVAAAVLEAINVMEGNEGKFNPKNTLNRVQGAAIIYRMMMGGLVKNPVGTSGFADVDDVPNYSWASGTVAACRDMGIIAGVSDTSFNPGGELTVEAYAKMLLVALGYDADKEGYTGDTWTTSVARDARARGILINTLGMKDTLTREQAAQMAYQTLTASMVEYKGFNITTGDTTINSPATLRLHSADEHVGVNQSTLYDYSTITPTTPIRFCEQLFPNLKLRRDNADETFGRTYSVWTWKGVEIAGTEATVAPNASFAYNANEGSVKDEIGKASATGADLYVNGRRISFTGAAKEIADNWTENGRVVEVYLNANRNDVIEKIVVVDVALGEVTRVDSGNSKITIKLANSAVTNTNTSLTTTVGYGEFDKGDMVLVTGYNKPNATTNNFYNNGTTSTTVATVEEAKSVSGLATFKDNNAHTITLDGNTYSMAYSIMNGYGFGDFNLHKTKDSTLYLAEVDGVEYVIKAIPAADAKDPDDNLIAVSSTYQSLVNNKIVNMVEGTLSNGQSVTWQLTTGTSINPASTGSNTSLYSYTKETNGQYTLSAVSTDQSLATTGDRRYYMADKGDIDNTKYEYSATAIRPQALKNVDGSNYMYADDVKFIFVDINWAKDSNGRYTANSLGTADITVLNGQQNFEFYNTSKNTVAYAVRNAGTSSSPRYEITAVFLTAEPDVYDSSNIIYVHQANPNNDQWVETDNGNAIYYGYDAYDANGEKIEDFRGDAKSMSNKFIKSQINEYEGYPMSRVNPNGTAQGLLTKANGLGGNAFILEGSSAGYFTNSSTTVVDLTNQGLDSVSEINKAHNSGTYRYICVALIYTGKTDHVAKTVFVYHASNTAPNTDDTPSGSSEVSHKVVASLNTGNNSVAFLSYGSVTTAEKIAALKDALVGDSVQVEGIEYLGSGLYNVKLTSGTTIRYEDRGSHQVGGIPTARKQYEMIQQAYKIGDSVTVKTNYETLAKADYVSHGAKINIPDKSSGEANITDIKWNKLTSTAVILPNFGRYDNSVYSQYAIIPVVSIDGKDLMYMLLLDDGDDGRWNYVTLNGASASDINDDFGEFTWELPAN